MNSCIFLIHNVKVSLTTNRPEFKNFVFATLQNYVIENGQNHEFQLDVQIDFNEKSQIKTSKYRIGNGVFFNDKEKNIAFRDKLFSGQFNKNNNKNLHIKGEVSPNLKDTLKNVLKSIFIKGYSYKDILFHNLYRELILLPTFWVLRNKFGLYLMHASAVTIGKQTFVFIGNDGVGKTTSALKLLKKEGALFFGDNFLLFDANRIHSFIDTLRVSKEDADYYFSSSMFKIAHKGKERVHLNFNKLLVSGSKEPTHFFVLRQAKKSFKHVINADELINYAFAINDYVKEFDKYGYSANLIFLFNVGYNIEKREAESLAQLTLNKYCALLDINRGEDIFDLIHVDH